MKTFEEKLKEDEFYNYLLKQRKFWEDKASECEIERSAELGYERVLQQLLRIEDKYLEIANRAETLVSQAASQAVQTAGSWVSVVDRLPTIEDADEFGKVLLYRNTNESQSANSKTIHDWNMVKYCDKDAYWAKLLPEPMTGGLSA